MQYKLDICYTLYYTFWRYYMLCTKEYYTYILHICIEMCSLDIAFSTDDCYCFHMPPKNLILPDFKAIYMLIQTYQLGLSNIFKGRCWLTDFMRSKTERTLCTQTIEYDTAVSPLSPGFPSLACLLSYHICEFWRQVIAVD